MDRPKLFTLFALFLAPLSLAGFVIALWAMTVTVDTRALALERMAFAVAGLATGATAGAAALGLWRMRPWVGGALRAYAVSVALGALVPLAVEAAEATLVLQIVAALLCGGVLWAFARHVEKRYAASVRPAA